MLKYGCNEKMMFFVFYWSQMTYARFAHLYFHYKSPSVKFCCCEFLVNVLTEGLFLTSTTPTLPIYRAGNCNVIGS